MNTKLIPFLLAILTISSSLSHATGNDLLRECSTLINSEDSKRTQTNYFEIGKCIGYMQGIKDTIVMYQYLYGSKKVVCLPEENIENGQAARIVVKYLNENPQDLHKEEAILSIKALQQAFPCQTNK